MQSFNITLPDAIANALNAYIKDQEVSIPANVVAEIALEDFLCQRGYLVSRKQGLSLTPAPKGSGFKDASVNHDKILAEQAFLQSLPANTP
ncbi:MAG: hypothetical protein RMY64_26530 [Nostoc sp. DedQUE08]|uniref:hypothetical protein n=1 Tax=unclassified Nostoc TaxID=2593658 RepID=UPI002AD53E11|nr:MULTISPECIES: hypothetical protein [unclassified Nostoc]MDZ8069128.1 hypothetical protein [Nostoc sp. DedQUE08]MDZ8090351.1 hypothetical protein [Nostoc sp. DedQUE05]MDZ8136359.1 hypothetical protein [Nostoc sp. DedQUE04]